MRVVSSEQVVEYIGIFVFGLVWIGLIGITSESDRHTWDPDVS